MNHPFLLSVERIEDADGLLMIVTELADANLKGPFDQYRKTGLPGVPYDELIQYIREAANALDQYPLKCQHSI